jgi:putative spermidine/putrescine transport system ATP-binding protein
MSVRIDVVTKRYGSVTALDEVSLEVADGEMVALLGPSGCGKTTLLRTIAGLAVPDAGRVLIDGADVTHVAARRRNVGMVFQSYALFPNLTVRRNVAFPLEVRGRAPDEIGRRTEELMALLALTDQAVRYPNQLSGGQQQRVALGRALAPAPAVLLLDEPLSALDALVRSSLRDEIRRVQQQLRMTAVYVTHDQSEAMAIADRVAVMQRGRIEQIAPPADLYDDPATRFAATFVGSRNAVELVVDGGRVRLGRAFELPVATSIAAAGSTVVAFFRPEDVAVTDDTGSGEPARVDVRLFLGAVTRLELVARIGDRPVRLTADMPTRNARGFEVGAAVRFRVDPDLVRVFATPQGPAA